MRGGGLVVVYLGWVLWWRVASSDETMVQMLMHATVDARLALGWMGQNPAIACRAGHSEQSPYVGVSLVAPSR